MKKINKVKILKTLEKIFREVFDDEKLKITEKTKATDIEEWDSLNQIKLIISCEKNFSIQLKPREVNTLQNVGEMLSHLTKKLSTKRS